MRPIRHLPLCLLLLASCASSKEGLPPNVVVLGESAIGDLMHQCSRERPTPGEGTWRPGPVEIAALEAALPRVLAVRHEPRDPDWSRLTIVICDGGRSFFGVEYDVESHRLVDIEFNGAI
jgi:hypothetical protein